LCHGLHDRAQLRINRGNVMNYSARKVYIVAFSSIFMLIGGVAIVSGLAAGIKEGGLFALAFGGVFFFAGFAIMRQNLAQLSKFEKKTYEWYKSTHPEHVSGNKISCLACGNTRIHVRALMNRSFHREHFCPQCGKTLYYSPEQS
jgi:predicted RNA-binding Zn-ribbon protein involved in translation (DUF1610 family)